jgi:outer membrane lipoprotein-sorting protein
VIFLAILPGERRFGASIDSRKDLILVAKRFVWLAFGLIVAALTAGAAFAQQAPVDLHEAAAKPAKTAAGQLSATEAVARANAWLDAARAMTADFVQIGPDGRRSEGALSLVRPGRIRFEYTQPARFQIVADGRSVAVIDRKLNTQDEYFIGQTPLKFLVADHIDIGRDTRVLSVAQEGNAVTIEIEDKAALGGAAHLTLVFDASSFALKQWTLIDAQGFQTVVTLSNLDLAARPDPALFHIDELPANQPGNRRK